MDNEDNEAETELYSGIRARYGLYIIFAALLLILIYVLVDYLRIPATFAAYNPEKADYYLENPEEIKLKYNENSDSIPKFAKLLLGDERLNVTLIRMDGAKATLAVETEDGLINNIKKGEMENPTMQLEMEEPVLKSISESESPVDELDEALDRGEIEYRGEKFSSKIKTAVFRGTISILSWFN